MEAWTSIPTRVASVDKASAADVNNQMQNANILRLGYISLAVNEADYDILTSSEEMIVLVTTAASNTIKLPKAVDNQFRICRIVKVDSGAGKVIVSGWGGTELIYGQTTLDIHEQHCGVMLFCDGTKWIALGGIGSCLVKKIGATWRLVYEKTLSGIFAAGSSDTIPHGIADFSKVIGMELISPSNATNGYRGWEYAYSGDGTAYIVISDDTAGNITASYGSEASGQPYHITLRYYR